MSLNNQSVHTYHCNFCSHLLVATTLHLPSLPTRQAPGLDRAIIAQLPPPPRNPDDSEEEDEEEEEEESDSEQEEIIEEEETEGNEKEGVAGAVDEEDGTGSSSSVKNDAVEQNDGRQESMEDADQLRGIGKGQGEEASAASTTIAGSSPIPSAATPPAVSIPEPAGPSVSLPVSEAPSPDPAISRKTKRIKRILPPPKDYTLLLSSTKDRSPKIITRDDGFEKRYLWRCGRCRVVIGYQLDDMHYPSEIFVGGGGTGSRIGMTAGAGGEGNALGGGGNGRNQKKRKRRDFVYFLPGALISTEDLGRDVEEKEAEFVGVEEKVGGIS